MDLENENDVTQGPLYSEAMDFIELILNNAKSDPSAVYNEEGELIGFKGATGCAGPTK